MSAITPYVHVIVNAYTHNPRVTRKTRGFTQPVTPVIWHPYPWETRTRGYGWITGKGGGDMFDTRGSTRAIP